MSVPISLTTFNAVKPSTPSIRVRSPRHPIQVPTNVEARRVPLTTLPAKLRRRRPAVAAVLFQQGFDLPVALGDLSVIHPVQLQGLGQLEEVLLPPVSLQ